MLRDRGAEPDAVRPCGGVDSRQAQPIDGPGGAHQRSGLEITEQGIVLDTAHAIIVPGAHPVAARCSQLMTNRRPAGTLPVGLVHWYWTRAESQLTAGP